MKKLLLAFLGCVCILSGCQETPDQVKKNMNGYGESKQIDLEGVDYCSPQELKNVDIEDITYKPDNLALPSKIDFSDVEDVGVVYFKAKEKFTDNRDEFTDLIGKGAVDWERSETAGGGWDFNDKDSEGWIQDNGTFGFWLGRYNQYVRSDNYLKITNRVYLGREDCPDLVCNLDGTSVSLKDVIAGTDRWVNEFKYLKGDLTYKARTVYVRTDDQGNDYVGLFYQPMYKGVGLSYLTYPMDNNISGDGVVIMADFPRVSGNTYFYLTRTGRINWIMGQIIFQIVSLLTYLLFVIISTLVQTVSFSFLINGWSLVVTESDKSSAMYDLIPMNLYNQMSPYEAFAISYLLLFMFLLSCSLAMLLASIYGKKTLTFWVVMISIAVGIVFCAVKSKWMWVFPVSNPITRMISIFCVIDVIILMPENWFRK